eukprot:scaffold75514_cov83-Phaeocystis_antarctica.AAC.1
MHPIILSASVQQRSVRAKISIGKRRSTASAALCFFRRVTDLAIDGGCNCICCSLQPTRG